MYINVSTLVQNNQQRTGPANTLCVLFLEVSFMVCKTKEIYCIGLYRRSLLTADLNHVV